MSDLTRRGTFGVAAAAAGMPFISWPFGAGELSDGDRVLVNQIGYLSGGPKRFLIHSRQAIEEGTYRFAVHDAASARRVDRLDIDVVRTSNDKVGVADMSGFDREGRFFLTSNQVSSFPFEISKDPFKALERSLLRAFYFQRCGTELKDPVTGLSHAACHAMDAYSRVGRVYKDRSGGWHDAGDFGKYVASTALAVGEILSLYEAHPSRFSDGELDLPESGDGLPDLLSEMRVGLAWLLKMQTPYGAFERKVAGQSWPSMTEPPEKDTQDRYVYGVSTGDTAKAGAALALAARIYRPFNAGEADTYLKAASEAWIYLANHPRPEIDREQSDDAGSGAYFDESKEDQAWDAGDRLWLAAELFITTGDRSIGRDFAKRARRHFLWSVSWADPSALGMLNYLSNRRVTDIDDTKSYLREKLIQRAEEFEKTSRLAPWQTADLEFGWGSNRNLAARGAILLAAYNETGRSEFLTAALSQVNYILGSNPLAISYVSGLGANFVKSPHHRLLLNRRQIEPDFVMPGLLVGGANAGAEFPALQLAKGPSRYVDDPSAFETNEFAIDHNAAFLALVGRLQGAAGSEKPGFFGRLRRRVGL